MTRSQASSQAILSGMLVREISIVSAASSTPVTSSVSSCSCVPPGTGYLGADHIVHGAILCPSAQFECLFGDQSHFGGTLSSDCFGQRPILVVVSTFHASIEVNFRVANQGHSDAPSPWPCPSPLSAVSCLPGIGAKMVSAPRMRSSSGKPMYHAPIAPHRRRKSARIHARITRQIGLPGCR